MLRLNPEESVFHLHYVIAQAKKQGCSYYEPAREEVGLVESILGKNALCIPTSNRSIRIAALDAAYASMGLQGRPAKSYLLSGPNSVKARKRAKIVCAEAMSILRKRRPKQGNKMRVLNVGVVGSFLSSLGRRSELTVAASDYYQGIVDRRIHGVHVESGGKTLRLLPKMDLAIVTGMTLANNTLDGILRIARKHDTAIVLFAQTGSHFASEYCRMGIDVVVSEPFPFYLTCAGDTHLHVYRRK
ncbi:Rossmann-like domain-containing protein [Elusimicrobiota bacterium]